MTILFADLAGSTALGERLDAEALKEVMGRFFAAMREQIEAEGGTVEKFIGDAVMAAFGVPVAHEDDPARALRAALRMQRRLDDLNVELAAAPRRRARDADRRQHRRGDGGDGAPRRARRWRPAMPSTSPPGCSRRAEPGQVLVGERTAAAVRGFALRGRRSRSTCAARPAASRRRVLVGERDEPARGVPGLRSPIVGRDRELELLGSLLRRAGDDGRAHLVTIYGDPGDRQEPARGRVHRAGRCPRRARAAACPTATASRSGRWPRSLKARGRRARHRPARGGARADRARSAEPAPELAARSLPALIRHDRPGRSRLASARPLAARGDARDPRRLARVLHHPRRGRAADRRRRGHPLGRRARMLDLLEELPDRIQAPVLFLCPARPELTARRPTLGRRPAQRLEHRARAARARRRRRSWCGCCSTSTTCPTHRASGSSSGPRATRSSSRRSCGRLIDEGLIVHERRAGGRPRGSSQVTIPDTVQGVLAARIDLLPADEKRAAAGRGRRRPGVLAGGGRRLCLNGDADRVEELLDGLRAARPRAGADGVGDGRRARADLQAHPHARRRLREPAAARPACRSLAGGASGSSATFGERRLEVAELLAHHYDLAGDRERARGYALEAARARSGPARARPGARVRRPAPPTSPTRAATAPTALIVARRGRLPAGRRRRAPTGAWREAVELLDADPGAEPAIRCEVCGRLALMLTRADGLMPGPGPRRRRRGGTSISGSQRRATTSRRRWSICSLPRGAGRSGSRDPPAVRGGARADATPPSLRAMRIAERLDRPDLLSIALDVEHICHELRDDVRGEVAG